jgi:hemolysin activation/secretion protein
MENWKQMNVVSGRVLRRLAAAFLFLAGCGFSSAGAKETELPVRFDIYEYRILGAKRIPQDQVEEAVYPYLGPKRTEADVEQARAAVEKIYKSLGYEAASVQIPPQDSKNGIVVIQVYEGEVAHLRVVGAKYHSPEAIKKNAPSVAEGEALNFKKFTADIMALNRQRDCRVTPSLLPGKEPGTVDVELNVQDSLPLHGSLELNNRYSSGTTELRLNGSLSYHNLWRLGHALGASFQIAPEDPNEVKVFSGYYMAPVPRLDWLSLMVQGTKQDSNVSTLGGSAVAGRGEIIGLRAIFDLPKPKGPDLYHSFTFGMDYKHFEQGLTLAGVAINTPITYYPFLAEYTATWMGTGYSTAFNAGLNFHIRGMGSDAETFDAKRFKSDGNYIYLRGEASHTHDLPGGLQIFAKAQGQIANDPLIDNEQFSGGGLTTVRGYLESEALGDNAMVGSIELRSPSLSTWIGKPVDEWRFYIFSDAGMLTLNEALPEQQDRFDLASYGVGSRIRILDHVAGSLDVGFPLIEQATTTTDDVLLTFQVSADF